jgi:alkylation response protein AidB-like acyl-CoA dehydrogenase
MNYGLTTQQRQMIGTVQNLAQAEFRSDGLEYMDGTFPWKNMRKLAGLGVLGMSAPEEYGGMGLPVFDTVLILEEIAKVWYVTAMAVLGEAGVQTRVIATYAPPQIVGVLNTEINKTLTSAEMKKFLDGEGAEAASMTPQEFGGLIRSETQRWIKVAREANIRIDY